MPAAIHQRTAADRLVWRFRLFQQVPSIFRCLDLLLDEFLQQTFCALIACSVGTLESVWNFYAQLEFAAPFATAAIVLGIIVEVALAETAKAPAGVYTNRPPALYGPLAFAIAVG